MAKLGHSKSTRLEVAFLERIGNIDRMVKERRDLRGALHAFEVARGGLKEVLASVSPSRADSWRMLWREYEINDAMIRVSGGMNVIDGARLLSLSLRTRASRASKDG